VLTDAAAAGDSIMVESYKITTITSSGIVTAEAIRQLAAAPTTQSDGTPLVEGDVYYDTVLDKMKVYNGSAWTAVGGGATGGGTDTVFFENGQTVNTNYTLTTGMNAGSFGPVTIANGVTVTIPDGQTWTIV
jgi:hypothetical protein